MPSVISLTSVSVADLVGEADRVADGVAERRCPAPRRSARRPCGRRSGGAGCGRSCRGRRGRAPGRSWAAGWSCPSRSRRRRPPPGGRGWRRRSRRGRSLTGSSRVGDLRYSAARVSNPSWASPTSAASRSRADRRAPGSRAPRSPSRRRRRRWRSTVITWSSRCCRSAGALISGPGYVGRHRSPLLGFRRCSRRAARAFRDCGRP